MSFDAKYATLCLLITYHWHASWAVSTWPSGGAGIAAEVNGSPTDARLNIPVVKRSSNQAELANEPPPRPGVVHGDSRESLVQNGAFGLSESTDRGYPSPKYMEAMIRLEEWRKGMIGGSLDDGGDGSVFQDGKRKKWTRDDDEGKEEMSLDQLIAGNIIPPRFLRREDRSFDHQRAFASISRGKRKVEDETKGTTVNPSEIDVRKTGDSRAVFFLGGKRKASLIDVGRLGGAGSTRRNETNDSQDQDSANLSEVSPLLQASNLREDGGKGPGNSGITLGVAKPQDASRLHQQSRNTKPRTIVQHLRGERQTNDHPPRLFRSRELRDPDIRARLYGRPVIADRRHRRQPSAQHAPNFTKFNGNPNQLRFIPFYSHYATNNPKAFGRRGNIGDRMGEPLTDSEQPSRQNIADLSSLEDETDIENLRESLSGVFDRHLGAERIHDLPNVRAILPKQVFVASPKLIYDTKILPAPFSLDKYFQSLGMPDNDRRNNGEKTTQLGSPVDGVFDPEDIKARFEGRPGKLVALYHPVGCQSPDTSYSRNNTCEKPQPRSAAVLKCHHTGNDGTSLEASDSTNAIDDFPATATRDDSKESVTSSRNFVTPLPPSAGGFSIGANHLGVHSMVSTRPDDAYQVTELEETTTPSTVPQPETFQRDVGQVSLNRKPPSKTGDKDPSGNTRSSYNTGSPYASKDKNGPRSGNQSTVIKGINDEYANHKTSRYSDTANIGAAVPTRTLPMRGQQHDHRYNEGSNKWRGHDDNDHARYDAKYSFGYLVNDDDSHNDFGHQEMRDEGITKGRYHVRLPDGRIQKVNYQVDDSGYHAVVSYRHDDTQ